MSTLLDTPTLEGSIVRLEPLARSHTADLQLAAEADRGAYAYTLVPRAPEVAGYLSSQFARAAAGKLVPFAQIRLADGRAVGCTALWDRRPWPDRPGIAAIEIGWTWLAGPAQRTGINVEAKLLLLRYAFGQLGVARVDLKTDARNSRVRQAIVALGAVFEGVLRKWSPSWAPGEQGELRDSAMFSVIASEWPACEQRLVERLSRSEG